MKILKLSDEQRILLKTSAQHPQLVARAPKHLPAAAYRAMVNRPIKRRLLIEVPALGDLAELAWRKNEKGKPLLLRLTDEGLRAIGIEPTTATSATVPTAARHCAPMVALKSERSSAQTAPKRSVTRLTGAASARTNWRTDCLLSGTRRRGPMLANAQLRG